MASLCSTRRHHAPRPPMHRCAPSPRPVGDRGPICRKDGKRRALVVILADAFFPRSGRQLLIAGEYIKTRSNADARSAMTTLRGGCARVLMNRHYRTFFFFFLRIGFIDAYFVDGFTVKMYCSILCIYEGFETYILDVIIKISEIILLILPFKYAFILLNSV